MPELTPPVAAATLLPHKGRMCCIDRLVALDEAGAEAEVFLAPEHVLAAGNGWLEPFGFIELAAQTAGAMYGAKAPALPLGMAMLVSVQKVAVRGRVRVGETLRIQVSVLGEVEGMISLAFSVVPLTASGAPGTACAEGRLTVFLPETAAAPPPMPASGQATSGPFVPPLAGNGLPESVARCLQERPLAAGQSLTGVYVFPPEFPGFDGHFPGNPIVPGIVQMMAALHTAACGAEAAMTAVKKCKFVRPVLPGEVLTVRAERSGRPEEAHCAARLTVANEPCAEMTFTYAPGLLP